VENAPAQFVQVTGLARRLAQRLLVVCENRLELLAVEVQEAHERLLHAALLALAVAALGLLAGLALSAAIVVMLWASSPVAALLALAVLYAVGAALFYRRLAVLRRECTTLPGTLGQLRKDCECLQRTLN
jgi:uncharacterized membrane protein YqjE